MLTVATRTHPGTVRANNEDGVLWNPDVGLMAIADGMGGHNAGEIASRLALDLLNDRLRSAGGSQVRPDPALSVSANRLLKAVKEVNQEIHRASTERSDCEGMGTTLTAALIHGARLAFVNVGDSRLYDLRDGQLRQLTRDDSWLEKLAEAGAIERTAAERHPMAHLLTSVIGPRAEIDLTVQEIELTDRETLLLCTDGMYRMVASEDIQSMLGLADIELAADRLVATALERDGRDNITVLVARHSAPTGS
jgi:protein phosphatase